MIILKEIEKSNWKECLKLKLKPGQEKFIASNLYSIAEVHFLDGFEAKAIYEDQNMIGFTMYGLDSDDSNYWIYRFMIDERYQGRGFGQRALELVIDDIRKRNDRSDLLFIGYAPENEQAKKLYAKVGFTEVGIMEWSGGEMIAKYVF
ncbi:GNAT family N-acetyltransferase [Paenibacillus sp. KN14-4R]|uniref:GNAT family N-acetyltransferase n=1 Tax=Paenibacillus sp. KN14-4R TaxID=3445773 RepID=UPI003F9F6664